MFTGLRDKDKQKLIFKRNNFARTVSQQDLIEQHLEILEELKYSSGLFAASSKNVGTGYDKSWLRDNFYECLAFFVTKDYETVRKTYRALLDIFIKHEYKIDWAIKHKPKYKHEYIHARYHPETFDEFWEEWGNKQNDAVGAILFMIGHLEDRGINVLEKKKDFEIVQKLVYYLRSVEYWHDEDNGMWEEDEEVHASSVGACVAGLKAIQRVNGIKVPEWLIEEGEKTLRFLLPRESARKFVDLALLSLIYPYDVVDNEQAKEILKNVEYHLVKKRGVIRYKNDRYYNKNPDGFSEEAEWTFGFSWLAIIYELRGNKKKAGKYIRKAIETINDKGEIPELYFSNSNEYNENSPLGWAESLFVVAIYGMNRNYYGFNDFFEK